MYCYFYLLIYRFISFLLHHVHPLHLVIHLLNQVHQPLYLERMVLHQVHLLHLATLSFHQFHILHQVNSHYAEIQSSSPPSNIGAMFDAASWDDGSC
jgi:hypothetical protein